MLYVSIYDTCIMISHNTNSDNTHDIYMNRLINQTYLQSGQIILDFSFDSVQFLEFFFKMFNGK